MKSETRLHFDTIVVVTDLTGPASSALRYAQAIARLHNSALAVVDVIDPVGYTFPDGLPNFMVADQAVRDELRRIEEETRGQGIQTHSVVEMGVIYERILQTVIDHHADLLVLGTRAKTELGRVALGTVARQLLAGRRVYSSPSRPMLAHICHGWDADGMFLPQLTLPCVSCSTGLRAPDRPANMSARVL